MGIAEPEVGVTITVQCPDNSDKVVHATPTSQSLPRGGKGRRRAMLLIWKRAKRTGWQLASRQRQKAKQSNVSRVQYPNLTLGGNKSD